MIGGGLPLTSDLPNGAAGDDKGTPRWQPHEKGAPLRMTARLLLYDDRCRHTEQEVSSDGAQNGVFTGIIESKLPRLARHDLGRLERKLFGDEHLVWYRLHDVMPDQVAIDKSNRGARGDG